MVSMDMLSDIWCFKRILLLLRGDNLTTARYRPNV